LTFARSICRPGDNFFKSATYTIEALVVDKIAEVKDKVENIERVLLDKRNDLKAFETVYREVHAHLFLLFFYRVFFRAFL
jgi:hypothetical protein